MTKISEIISKELTNKSHIYLYKEGIFYKAYEQSAYIWNKLICQYEVKSRNIKSLGDNILSIGFPMSALKKRVGDMDINYQEDNVVIDMTEKICIAKEDFDEWKNINVKSLSEKQKDICDLEENIVEKIKKFPIETSTPIDCMIFLSDLKKKL